MRKTVCFLVLSFFIGGCAGAPVKETPSKPPRVKLPGAVPKHEAAGGLGNIENKDLQGYVRKKGIVFAKTDFQGVLQATYVRLRIEGQDRHTYSFNLDIEGKPEENTLFGSGKMVKPGYFFIELPEGSYRISSIGIPVGSTLAEEETNLTFEVFPNSIVYMGTLKVVGTNERIKLGGVPVIKPGFDYQVEVLDERSEGIYAFHKRYPNIPVIIETHLMRVNPNPEKI